MDKREFIKSLALLAAGISALPAQVEAFERYYTANTPTSAPAGQLIAIDQIVVSGMATRSMPAFCKFYTSDQCVLPFGVNLFGGMVLWKAGADQKIITTKSAFRWRISGSTDAVRSSDFVGSISYIDDGLVRRTHEIGRAEGSLEGGDDARGNV
jgi:hypothetical protein